MGAAALLLPIASSCSTGDVAPSVHGPAVIAPTREATNDVAQLAALWGNEKGKPSANATVNDGAQPKPNRSAKPQPPSPPPSSATETAPAAPEPVTRESTAGANDYRISVHDVLSINVYGEPDISMEYRVSSMGEISHPFLGRVKLLNMSADEAEVLVSKLLDKDYLVDPKVSLRVVRSARRRVIIFGQVKKPGEHYVPPDQPMTLLRAIATAGGFTQLAAMSRVRVVRRNRKDEEEAIYVDVSDILRGRGTAKDIPLDPDDIITVPESVF